MIAILALIGAGIREKQVISPAVTEILSWEEDLKLHLFEPVEVRWVSAEDLEVKLKNGVVVNFSQQKEREFQFDSLQLILRQIKIEGRPIKRIDLRYDKPVLAYE